MDSPVKAFTYVLRESLAFCRMYELRMKSSELQQIAHYMIILFQFKYQQTFEIFF